MARTAETTPTPKEQDEGAGTVDTTKAAAAKGADTSAVESVESGDKLVWTRFPIDLFPVTVGEGDAAVTYELAMHGGGVVVKADHLQAVRDIAKHNHVQLRTKAAPTA